MQLGKTPEAIERCELVIKDLVPKYDKKDVLGILNLFIPIIRVLKWPGGVNRARGVFEQYMPEAPEHRLGKMRRAMLLLLSLCSDDDSGASSYNTDNLESDIALVLELDFPEMFDGVMTSICWSMKSFVAELCLELARRLEPSCSTRYELIQKGIRYSLVADERVRGQNTEVKHIVAHEAHQAVLADLLRLRLARSDASVKTIYGNENVIESFGSSSHDTSMKLSKRLTVDLESNGSMSNDTKKELAKRLIVKESIAQSEMVGKKVSFMPSSRAKNRTSELSASFSSQASNGSRSKNKTSELSASVSSQASNGSTHGSTEFYGIAEDSPSS